MMALTNSRFSRAISLLISIWVLCGVLPICTQAVIEYEVIDLGTLGGNESYAYSINDVGQIVGSARFNTGGDVHATLFDSTRVGNNIDLDPLGGWWSTANSINNVGQIVGRAKNNQGSLRAFLFDSTGDGNNIDLGTLGGFESSAMSINNAGQIVGYAQAWPSHPDWYRPATLFDATGAGNNIDLGTLEPYLSSVAHSINDAGQIVGFAWQATLFDSTGTSNNISLGGYESVAWSINNVGQIVGREDGRATLFDSTGAENNIDLGTLGGEDSEANAINDAGQIVGHAQDSNGQWYATLFDATGSGNNINLNTLINPLSNWTLTTATDINRYGWIVGWGTNPAGEQHAFLLSPQSYKYSGGTGEPNDPYQIATAADLIALGESPEDYDKHFILTADIDLDPNLPGRKVFNTAVIAPHIGNQDLFKGTPFTGVFDGNSHTISNLTIEGGCLTSLFGLLESGAEVRDIGILDVNIIGTGPDVGGLIAENQGYVANCYCTGMISGDWGVGGLVGNNYGSINNCYSNSTVSGNNIVGGLVGYNYGVVIHCYSNSTVSGGWLVGGLVGSGREVDATSCFWDIETSGQTTSDAGTGKTTAEMQTASTFLEAGWDFIDEVDNGTDDIWKIWDGYDYPRLSWETGTNMPLVFVDINDLGFCGQMGKYEVTNDQYCDFLNAAMASGDITIDGNDVLGASGSNSGEDYAGQRYYRCNGSGYTGYGATHGGASRIHYNEGVFSVDEGFGNHPVTYVSWYGAMAFCNYYGYYLPAEDQWQAVADFDGTYFYGCGQIIDPGIANYRVSEHPDGTAPVGSFGIYGYGMSDMAGNVWEWTSSSLGDNRIFRGGSMGSVESDCDVSIRADGIPYANYWDIGFRVCR